MKLNSKLFLLTFTIITFVSVTSAFIYHTLTHKLLQDQQSETLITSANNFIFKFDQTIKEILEEEIFEKNFNINSSKIDFVIKLNDDKHFGIQKLSLRKGKQLFSDVKNFPEFIEYNSNYLVFQKESVEGLYLIGKEVDRNLINDLSDHIRSELSLVENGVINLVSHKKVNEIYLPELNKVSRELHDKNNFELAKNVLDNQDIIATHFFPKHPLLESKAEFLIFSVSNEAAVFKSTMNTITATIVIAGILLTIVTLLIFTMKFRKQLDYINRGVKKIAEGKTHEKVKVIANDEIGKLGSAFNNMIDEIEKRDEIEKEYTEFISLINQNPTLEEISKSTLNKIITTTKTDVGALYLVDKDVLLPVSTVGNSNRKIDLTNESNFYTKVIESKESLEFHFNENAPAVKSGILEIKINHLFLYPIIYNNEVLAILELGSTNKPASNISKYFDSIKDQLSIGLANGKAFDSLEKYVNELQELNAAYEEQNKKITKQNEELLKLHNQLTRGNKELEIEREKAIEATKLKSEFLANMSHELRTPQNSILGLTELVLSEDEISEKTKDRLNVVLRNGKKLLTLIENILEYSKLESGVTTVDKSEIELTELVNEIKYFVEPLFIQSDVDFQVNYPKNYSYKINTDVQKVEQIIINLIGNAIKFTNQGFVKLDVSVNNNALSIVVEDSGVGISDDDIKIIFDEFRQADSELNRKYNGTGLGLAICKKYTDLLNGEITVKSKLREGTIFSLTLPNTVVEKVEKQIETVIEKTKTDNLKALVISDGANATQLISDYLNSNNIITDFLSSDQYNFEEISNISPDVIILNVLLSNNNGWEIFYKLKNDEIYSQIPIVIVNMDEEANCGFGLKVYNHFAMKLSRNNVHRIIDTLEQNESIKFRKILFVTNTNTFKNLEEELIFDDLKVFHTEGNKELNVYVSQVEPDLIITDLFDEEIDSFKIINQINSDLYSKDIPIVTVAQNLPNEIQLKRISNNLFELTLLAQKHPLDVLKVIRDRIDLIDSNIFSRCIEIDSKSFVTQNTKIVTNKHSDKIKVLITDDNDDARFTIGQIVESLGYKTLYASDGYECLKTIEEDEPDLVLLDIMMPNMDGFQTIKKVRADKRFTNLKVYALTAYAMLSDKDIVEKNGFDGLITKPVNAIQLQEKLKNIFSLV